MSATSRTSESENASRLVGCPHCTLVQRVPTVPQGYKVICQRCGCSLAPCHRNSHKIATACAVAALILYIPAIFLPLLRIEKLGHFNEDSLLGAIGALFAQGHLLVGLVVLLFSVLMPPIKLTALCLLLGRVWGHKHRALIHRSMEILGRWGMLDVMLMAILLAYIKLGDLIRITAGPGLSAFTAMVLLSLLAGTLVQARCLWEGE